MLTQDAASQRCIVVIVMSTLDPQGRRSSAAWQPGITLQELDMADVLRLWDSLLSESLSTKAIQGHPRPHVSGFEYQLPVPIRTMQS